MQLTYTILHKRQTINKAIDRTDLSVLHDIAGFAYPRFTGLTGHQS